MDISPVPQASPALAEHCNSPCKRSHAFAEGARTTRHSALSASPGTGREPGSLEKDHLHFPGGRDKTRGVPRFLPALPFTRELCSHHVTSKTPAPSRKQPCLDHVSGLAKFQGQVKPFLPVTRWKAAKENEVFYRLFSYQRAASWPHEKH